MYNSFDYINGQPPRLYRTPNEIKNDIAEIAERIAEINEMLNVRNIISEIISEQSEDDARRRAMAVEELADFAAEVLVEMEELEESLASLRDELSESIGLIGAG